MDIFKSLSHIWSPLNIKIGEGKGGALEAAFNVTYEIFIYEERF